MNTAAKPSVKEIESMLFRILDADTDKEVDAVAEKLRSLGASDDSLMAVRFMRALRSK